MAKKRSKRKEGQEAIQAGRERWVRTWVKTSLPRAMAKASQERGACEWQACAALLVDRLQAAGVDIGRVEFKDGWGEEEDYPYYWGGKGELTIGYAPKDAKDGAAAACKICKVLEELKQQGALLIEDTGVEGDLWLWSYVKALI